MNTIKNYLESMFQALPKTEEVLRLKNELLNNMEEKYEELKEEGKTENEAIGIVISEFGNIDELLKEMDINLDSSKDSFPTISLEEANKFITLKEKTSNLIGTGVFLIIFGVSLLILLSELIANELIFQSLSSNAQGTLPVILLFLFIVPAVGLFIYSGTKLESYKYIDKGEFEISSATKAILNERFAAFSPKQTLGIIIGVCLCILSPVAIFISNMFSDTASFYGVITLLIMVAIAVFIFIHFGGTSEAYKKLLKTGDFNPARRKQNKVIGAVASVIWPLATCIFLITGLVFNLWHINWIIFPITGMLFGAFCAFYSTMKENN